MMFEDASSRQAQGVKTGSQWFLPTDAGEGLSSTGHLWSIGYHLWIRDEVFYPVGEADLRETARRNAVWQPVWEADH